MLESMFLCPTSGMLFAAHSAHVDVVPARVVNVHRFHCPRCRSSLTVLPPGQKPVARCSSCDWATDHDRTGAVADLIFGEGLAFPEATASFEELQTLLYRSNSMRAPSTSAKVASLLDHAPLPESCRLRPSAIGTFCSIQDERDAQRRGFSPLPRQAPLSAAEQPWHGHESIRSFRACVRFDHILHPQDRLVRHRWDRSCMPPRRATDLASVLLHSPFNRQIVAKGTACEPLKYSPMNASQFMPRANVRRHDTLRSALVIAFRNEHSHEMQVDLSILDQNSTREDIALKGGAWAAGNHSGVLQAGSSDTEFVLLLEETKKPFLMQLALRVRLNPTKSRALGISREELVCRLILSVASTPLKLP